MSNYRSICLIATLAFIIPAQPLLAAAFCLQTQTIGPQCDYFDAIQCRKRASELSGYCVANPAELVINSGGVGRYCLVLSSRQAQCIYSDYSSCQNDAGPANGVCIEESATRIAQDPYQFDANRQY